MRNPFKRLGNPYSRRTPEGEPLEGHPRSFLSNKLKILAGIVTFVVIVVVMAESVVIVQAGHRGVVLYLGAVENRVLAEGVHFIVPFVERVIQLEVRTLKFQAESSAASNDLQEVQTVIALNYHIDPNDANVIYQQLGEDYADRIIAPTIQESVKASVAKFNAEELIAKRETARANVAKAGGESQAIKIITEQLRQSPQYLQWQAINRWNGQMPYSLGSSGVPFFQLPTVPQLQQNQTAQSSQTR